MSIFMLQTHRRLMVAIHYLWHTVSGSDLINTRQLHRKFSDVFQRYYFTSWALTGDLFQSVGIVSCQILNAINGNADVVKCKKSNFALCGDFATREWINLAALIALLLSMYRGQWVTLRWLKHSWRGEGVNTRRSMHTCFANTAILRLYFLHNIYSNI